MTTLSSPVIVTGMHCSGTTLLSRILQGCGLFMGRDRNQHEEATFFRGINRIVLDRAGVRWDDAEAFAAVLQVASRRNNLEGVIAQRVHSIRIARYWGFSRYVRLKLGASLSRPWGWKDPRNCLTLPLWLSVFPTAKVIHVARNGVDVVASLHRREARRQSNQASQRCLELDGGFSLWIAYETMLLAVLESLPSSRQLSLRYETLVESPAEQVDSIAEFLGCGADSGHAEDVIAEIRADSANAYRNSESLSTFHAANKNHPLMNRFCIDSSGHR